MIGHDAKQIRVLERIWDLLNRKWQLTMIGGNEHLPLCIRGVFYGSKDDSKLCLMWSVKDLEDSKISSYDWALLQTNIAEGRLDFFIADTQKQLRDLEIENAELRQKLEGATK